MLSLFASSAAFQGPAMKAGGRSTAVQMRAEGEIGVTPPLGVYDPLNILATPVVYPRKDYRRYQELEIKHGRISMLACVGVITTEAGFRWPGYLSKSLDLKFEDVPGGALDSYAAVPALGWPRPLPGIARETEIRNLCPDRDWQAATGWHILDMWSASQTDHRPARPGGAFSFCDHSAPSPASSRSIRSRISRARQATARAPTFTGRGALPDSIMA